MRTPYSLVVIVMSTLVLSAACSSTPNKSPVKEVQVQGSDTVAQSYAIEEPEVGGAEALTAEPVIQGASLGSDTDLLLGDVANGGQVFISQFRQQVVLVNYWSSVCSPCVQRMQEMTQISADYQPFGLVVVNVNLGDSPRDARSWLEANGTGDFSGLQLTDVSGLATGGVGIVNVPAVLLFDRNGMEVRRYAEISNVERIRQDLDLLLK